MSSGLKHLNYRHIVDFPMAAVMSKSVHSRYKGQFHPVVIQNELDSLQMQDSSSGYRKL